MAVDTFSGIAAVLARRGGEGARQQFLQADLSEVLVCSLLVLTEAGELWRLGQQQATLLVRLVSLYRKQMVAVMEDGADDYFPPDCAAPCTGSARQLLPGGGSREAEVMRGGGSGVGWAGGQ